jgi:hypothetical protein
MAEESDEEYTIPLAGPAPYGAGIKKKGIKFVSAGSLDTQSNAQARSGEDIANSYLALVLDRPSDPEGSTSKDAQQENKTVAKCRTCNLPLNDAEGIEHHTSLAHQVALTHIHPPSAIDRTRKGFAYLESHGWDPDSRLGLGAQGEGILRPIHTKEKKDKAGIGDRSRSATPNGSTARVQKGPQGLDPKALKKLEQQKAKRGKRLHDMFYTNDEVAKYLGEDV